jgi:hypothetical protein
MLAMVSIRVPQRASLERHFSTDLMLNRLGQISNEYHTGELEFDTCHARFG